MNQRNTILITGCSSGFGKATANHFLHQNWNVIATMRSPRSDLFEETDRLHIIPLDVTCEDSISSAISSAVHRFGKIDAIVNNAGIGMFGAHEAVRDKVIREVFETNTFGVMAMNRAIIPHFRSNGSGTIVNVTSSVGIAPMPLVAAYTASKYAIEGFSESLAHELSMFGIRVRIVQPGFAPSTDFTANSGDRCSHAMPQAYAGFAERYFKSMGNYPTDYTNADDVAEAVYSAVTENSDTLRYPAGADSRMLAGLRKAVPEEEFMDRMRTMFGQIEGSSEPRIPC